MTVVTVVTVVAVVAVVTVVTVVTVVLVVTIVTKKRFSPENFFHTKKTVVLQQQKLPKNFFFSQKKLKSWNGDETLKLTLWWNSKTQIVMKVKKKNYETKN